MTSLTISPLEPTGVFTGKGGFGPNTDGGGLGPLGFLNADRRGSGNYNGHPSFTSAEAGAHITRDNISWNGSTLGQAANVTFAFRGVAPASMPNGTSGFSTFNAQQIAQTLLALQSWSDLANVTFTRVDDGNGFSSNAQMLFGNYSAGAAGAAAFAYFPGAGLGGDSWYNSTLSYNTNPQLLNYGRQVLTHEIGHALGLNHPGDYNAGQGNPTYGDADYYEDTRQYSVMSYWSEVNTSGVFLGQYSAAPLMDDISAIQRLYGANMTTRTGDTIYGFNSNTGRDFYSAASAQTAVIFAVWDAGGTDTLDFSGYAQNGIIDLRQGHFSSVGGLIGNVSIAMGAVIENAIGGTGSDLIVGNAAANALTGGGGADILLGGLGDDVLTAGAGGGAPTLYKPATKVYPNQARALSVDDFMSLAANANIGNATTIPHATVIAQTSNAARADWYSVTVGASGTLTLDIDGASFDTVIQLYNAAGTILATNDDASVDAGSVTSTDSRLTFSVAPGEYFIRVVGFGLEVAPPGGTYTLHISAPGATVPTGTAGSTLWGEGGQDTLISGAGNDRLDGGGGIDTVSYATATAAVVVGLDRTIGVATGGGGRDTLIAIENLIGSDYNDRLVGSAGDNRLTGGAGRDTIRGEDGDDWIYGGMGGDTLTGGAGIDIFVFNAAAESVSGTADRITDLEAHDIIDLRGIDANPTRDGDQRFTIASAFTNRPGQLVISLTSGGDTLVQGDVNGDGVSDFELILNGDQTGYTGWLL